MKKTKLLIPALSIAGLATVVAPMATMTSCGSKGESKSDWKTITKADFDAVMDPLYTAFNKEENLNSFAPSDLTVKYKGKETTSYVINNRSHYAEGQFDHKYISLDVVSQAETSLFDSPKNESDTIILFYPKTEIQGLLDDGYTMNVSKNKENYKCHLTWGEMGMSDEQTYIFNEKGYSTYYERKMTSPGNYVWTYKYNIEYKSDLHEVKDYTFVSDKNQYKSIECIMQNDTTYTFNVEDSKAALSKLMIEYYDKSGVIRVLDLQNGVTIEAGGETLDTRWETNHLEFEEQDKGTDICIILSKDDLPEGINYFVVNIYNE